MNCTHSTSLRIVTSFAYLSVDRVATYKADASSRPLYRVCSQYDESLCFGSINLDEDYRARQQDHLKFVVLHAHKEQGREIITALMCIEKLANGGNARVQVLRVQIDEDDWRRTKPVVESSVTIV
jgi:hypothetical protein